MAWRTGPMDSKVAFIRQVKEGSTVEEAALGHGVSRSCGYKTLKRFDELGFAGLEERPRVPHRMPKATPEEKIERLVKLKQRYPHFGPVALVAMIEQETGEHFLADSTAGKILAEHGLVKRRRRRTRGAGPIEHPPFEIEGPGHSMTVDYKGQFRTKDRRLCYPLTVVDPATRFIYAIEALPSTSGSLAKKVFERVFREHGVPVQIISDNGTPFASARSLGGLTEVSRWLIELGSTPVRIEPGCPQQNGRHERMHRTLKERITSWPQRNLAHQQRVFDEFMDEYNNIRPHRALGKLTPAAVKKSYPGKYPDKIIPIEYDEGFTVRRVRSNGQIKWRGEYVFLTEVLVDYNVGLSPLSDSTWEIYYGHVRIGYLDESTMRATNKRPTSQRSHVEQDEDE